MEECNIYLSKIEIKNKKKHCLTKKHKHFSNLNINKYIVNDPKNDKLNDIILPYYNNHKKKFDTFTVCLMFKKNGELKVNISVPSMITREKRYMIASNIIGTPIVDKVTSVDHLDTFYSFITSVVDEIKKIHI